MTNKALDKSNIAAGIVLEFIGEKYCKKEFSTIEKEVLKIQQNPIYDGINIPETFAELQMQFSNLNERTSGRKKNGVYYTPNDLTFYIVTNAIKLWNRKLTAPNLHVKNLNGVPYYKTSFKSKVFDPTCGVGEFILVTLEIKLDLVEMHRKTVSKSDISKIVKTLYGNDISQESTKIAKLRILMKLLERYGADAIVGISDILNENFQHYNFITEIGNEVNKYDIIVGNPPYVEDRTSGLELEKKYGNIYANVIDNSAQILNENGTMGFVIPLSYVSTPRMTPIRNVMFDYFNKHYVLSFSDRPDSLFSAAHQKLCVCFFGNNGNTNELYTSSYNYWYKDEREDLFEQISMVKNNYRDEKYIPKLGSKESISIYKKVLAYDRTLFEELNSEHGEKLYLNMRAAFWIKVFDFIQKSSEYKEYICSEDNIDFIYCLLNSSLFWWYWICISDCWHITQKELKSFTIPDKANNNKFTVLAKKLKKELELTKVYVGTKQIDYEYKHKECIETIHRIDDAINNIYGLTDKESTYIKNFALRYRIGGGIE